MINVAILDDELHGRKILELLLKENNQINIVELYENPVSTLQDIKKIEIDILFLDIEMPQLNGFEFLKLLKEYNFTVIFTTAYSEYAIKAFKYAAFDFLLKPICIEDLNDTILRWENTNKNKTSKFQVDFLEQLLQQNTINPKKITLSTKEGVYMIYIQDIIYCEADSNYTTFHLKDNKKIITSKTLKEFEEILLEHQFIRAHKSYLINIKYISKLIKGTTYSVEMDNGITIPVSRNKNDELKLLLKDMP